MSDVNAQGSHEELDLDNEGWDLLMDTMPKYSFCVGSQKLRIDTEFFVQLRKRFYFSHVISNDLRVKIALKAVGFMTSKEALESTLTSMTMLSFIAKRLKRSECFVKTYSKTSPMLN